MGLRRLLVSVVMLMAMFLVALPDPPRIAFKAGKSQAADSADAQGKQGARSEADEIGKLREQ